MRKTILTILGSALIAASTVQLAAAAERHQARKLDHASVLANQRIRSANDLMTAPSQLDWHSPYQAGGAMSAPAGR